MKKFFYGILTAIILIGIVMIFYAGSVANSARLVSNLTVYETLTTPTQSFTVDVKDMNETVNYRDGLTRYDVDHVWSDTVSGAGTIYLTSLTNTLGESLDLTGEVIMAIKFQLEDVSGASCLINKSTNGYKLLGDTFAFTLYANQSMLLYLDNVLAVVANGTNDEIDYNVSDATTMLSILLISADGYQ